MTPRSRWNGRSGTVWSLAVTFTVAFDRETDGRWIASVRELPGAHVYGTSQEDALARAQALAFEVLADEIAHGERDPATLMTVTFEAAQAA
jgi:predicted RNase H-like HicB family nuclease